MVGGARTALEVGRLLLSLDPIGDPMGCLLALDSHALASQQGGFLVELYQSNLPIGRSPTELASFALSRNASGEFPCEPRERKRDGQACSEVSAWIMTTC